MPAEKECGVKCRSRRHVGEITSLLTSPSCKLQQFQAYSALCNAWYRLADQHGRTALHLAASCGHPDIVQWLLEEGLCDQGVKDSESGHTALHRALFYGHLSCARLLMQFNSDLHVRDTEGLSPLDLVMLDKPAGITYAEKEPNEVYTWGENYNSTLGHPSPHKRTSPEVVDHFKKTGVCIKQVVLCKYHCVFLSQSGQVYTCGHGQGGRLGHGDQHTVLVPRVLECLKEHTCLEVAAATDHTVLRMEGSIVYSFGINSYHQLGQTPFVEKSPLPKQVNLKSLKGKSISGVCVGRFHSVVWTPDSVFTVGLNAGQLGVPRGEKYLSQLRQVSSLRHTDVGISLVACSDAATVCLTTKGDVYVLHEYQCRKIASKWQEIEQVIVCGGNLDHNTGLDILREKGGHDLHIALKNESGQLFLWRSNSPSVKRCQFALKRQLSVRDIAMTTSCLVFSTDRGEAFVGYFSNKKIGGISKDSEQRHSKEVKDCGDGFNQPRLLDLLLREEVEDVQVRRLPGIHRATSVASDKKARNFAVLQALPNGILSELPSVASSDIQTHFNRLLQEADSEDSIHDVVVKAGGKSWLAHKYILAMRSDFFRNTVLTSEVSGDTCVLDERPVVSLPGVSAEIMEQILTFIYTDTCAYLTHDQKVKMKTECEPRSRQLQSTENIDATGLSAFQVQQRRQSGKGQNHKKSAHHKAVYEDGGDKGVSTSQNPVQILQEVARKLGVKGLSKRLEGVKCINGSIVSQGKRQAVAKIRFDVNKLKEARLPKPERGRCGDGTRADHRMVNVTRMLEQQLTGTSDGREGLEIQRQTTTHGNVKLTTKKTSGQLLTRTSRRQEGGLQAQQYTSHQRGTDEDRGHLSSVLAMPRILGVSITND
ncbi:inhibitor of bruton agammaglobulinemia tyrosine kinase [Plakobranchus ocellatus]|uniref:Inhibitor of bruton agammaglobulinemia tyrosine kinase n=1 Tax=Plakobranchus ocellatus TaxID=259542 RepID=A0AAV4BYT3_9GAST|nr:inhibitor of bruton agammaglobulinemia tyrosine kinase [Plakobranchus ocellatus]